MPANKKIKKATASSRPTTNDKDYADFLSRLELIGLGLKSSSATLNREVFWKVARQSDAPTRQLVESYEPSAIGKNWFEVEGRYEVTVADGDAIALEIKCAFELHLHAPAPINRALVRRFANDDLRFMLLPYARHFISDITGEMNIPPIVLPLAAAPRQTHSETSRAKR